MTTPAAANYISNAARTEGELKTELERLVALDKELLGGAAEAELTVSAGSVTPATARVKIRGEGGVDDELATIATTNHPDGRLLMVRASNPGPEDITLKHGTGNLSLAGAADFLLDHVDKVCWFARDGSTWKEVGRFYGGQKAALRAFLGLAIGSDVQAFDATIVKSGVQTTFTRQQNFGEVALTHGASVAWNLQTQQNARLSLGATAATLANPTNAVAGGTYILHAIQDGTGGRTLLFDTNYDFGSAGAPDLTALSAGQSMIITFYYSQGKMRATRSVVYG